MLSVHLMLLTDILGNADGAALATPPSFQVLMYCAKLLVSIAPWAYLRLFCAMDNQTMFSVQNDYKGV